MTKNILVLLVFPKYTSVRKREVHLLCYVCSLYVDYYRTYIKFALKWTIKERLRKTAYLLHRGGLVCCPGVGNKLTVFWQWIERHSRKG